MNAFIFKSFKSQRFWRLVALRSSILLEVLSQWHVGIMHKEVFQCATTTAKYLHFTKCPNSFRIEIVPQKPVDLNNAGLKSLWKIAL